MGRGRYFCEVQNAIIVLHTNGYGRRYQEPNLGSACLDHGHVKPCSAYVGHMLGLSAYVGPCCVFRRHVRAIFEPS